MEHLDEKDLNPNNSPEDTKKEGALDNQENNNNPEGQETPGSAIQAIKSSPLPIADYPPDHKAGFVNIIGNPNVGKSTLMNNMIGENLSIITSKAQTTRHRIFGIVNGEKFQIIFSDTPGILKPSYKLQQAMLKYVDTALEDADVLIYVTDITEKIDKNIDYIEKIKRIAQNTPKIVVLNKIDLADQAKVQSHIEQLEELFPDSDIIPVSALYKFNLDKLFKMIIEKLPFSPPYFEKDQLTDRPVRFFVAEIIRKNILELYRQEVPYSVEVGIEEFKELPHITRIRATIYVAKESQKPIIIGKGGQAIKQLGIKSRQEIEEFIGSKVYLELYVKVSKNWRNDVHKLRMFGYDL